MSSSFLRPLIVRPDWLASPVDATARRSRPVGRLLKMLRHRRPHATASEREFAEVYLDPIPGVRRDGFGNRLVDVGDAPRVVWSSHIDTVHREGGLQDIVLGDDDYIRLAAGSPSNCLGADDTAGVWLMLEMLRFGIPGRYIFHRGEERGGLGSSYLAEVEPDSLTGIDAAIAFDRRGVCSVITAQLDTCASDAFAKSLAMALRLPLAPDPTGVFTDTANYSGLVPECTNLSVGYYDEHTPHECLDLRYLLRLREALASFDASTLVIARDPDADCYDYYPYPSPGRKRGRGRDLADLVAEYPDVAADLLEQCGLGPEDLLELVEFSGGNRWRN